MSNATPAADGEPEVIDALHRLYIESLPDEQQTKILERASESVRQLHLHDALERLARDSELDRLQKWHLIASAIHRRPELLDTRATAERLVTVIVNVGETEVPIDEATVYTRLQEFGERRRQEREQSEGVPPLPRSAE